MPYNKGCDKRMAAFLWEVRGGVPNFASERQANFIEEVITELDPWWKRDHLDFSPIDQRLHRRPELLCVVQETFGFKHFLFLWL